MKPVLPLAACILLLSSCSVAPGSALAGLFGLASGTPAASGSTPAPAVAPSIVPAIALTLDQKYEVLRGTVDIRKAIVDLALPNINTDVAAITRDYQAQITHVELRYGRGQGLAIGMIHDLKVSQYKETTLAKNSDYLDAASRVFDAMMNDANRKGWGDSAFSAYLDRRIGEIVAPLLGNPDAVPATI